MSHAECSHPYKVPANLSNFFVVTVLSNSCRYQRRYELYTRFKEMCQAAGVKLITVEQSFGDRKHMVTSSLDPMCLQVNSVEELWHKENMINMGIAYGLKLMPEMKYVCWIDADCRPARMPRDWFEETWHELQHYEFVQMWESMIDLDHQYSPLGVPMESFMASYVKAGCPDPEEFWAMQKASYKNLKDRYPYGDAPARFGRPGLAWAASIEALSKVGGLIDFSILGAGDWHMAHGLIGTMNAVAGEFKSSSGYVRKLLAWQTLAIRYIKRDVGYVRGLVYHDSHGLKVNRKYGTRGQILVSNGYDPEMDIKYDMQGHLMLETHEPRQIKIRDQIRAYFRDRNDDETT